MVTEGKKGTLRPEAGEGVATGRRSAPCPTGLRHISGAVSMRPLRGGCQKTRFRGSGQNAALAAGKPTDLKPLYHLAPTLSPIQSNGGEGARVVWMGVGFRWRFGIVAGWQRIYLNLGEQILVALGGPPAGGGGEAGEMDCRAFAHGRAGLCEPPALPAAKGNMTLSRPFYGH